MPNPECPNPKEVLAHLNSLGYHDVNPQQLKEFIHDLIKLIKYEQKRKEIQLICPHSCNRELNTSILTDSSSEKSVSSESCVSSVCSVSYECSKASECSEASEASETTETSESSSTTYKRNFSTKPNWKRKDYCEKVPTSFIRPCLSNKHRKNPDPVRLYHQYRQCWNQYKIPGETSHSDLRWLIRNRMLGQEPTPRCILN